MSKPDSLPPDVEVTPSDLVDDIRPPKPIVQVQGEPFYVEWEASTCYLLHERWSLMGAGPSLSAAFKNLLEEASEVRLVYARMPIARLDPDAIRLQKYLLRFA